jgi:hypothetical protein
MSINYESLLARSNIYADSAYINDIIIGTLTVTNVTATTVNVNGNETIGGTLDVTGQTNLGILQTSGNATLNSVNVNGNSNLNGIIGVNASIQTLGVTTGLSVTGTATLASLSNTGNATIGGTLNVTGQTNLGILQTSGNATLNSVNVNGNSNLNGIIGVNASIQTLGVTTGLSVTGTTTLASLSNTGNATIGGTLGVTGNTTLSTLSTNDVVINNSGHNVTLSANPTGTCNFQFPPNGGTNNYILKTDGSGNTSWVAPPNATSSSSVGAYYSGTNTSLSLSGASQNVPGLSASITLPAVGNYHIRADYVVNLEGISLNSNVYCYASSSVANGAGTGAYIQAYTPPSSTPFCTNVLTGSGFLNNFGSGFVGVSPYSFTGGSSVTVNVKIYTSSSLSTSITYIAGETDSSGGYWVGSNLVLSCVPV